MDTGGLGTDEAGALWAVMGLGTTTILMEADANEAGPGVGIAIQAGAGSVAIRAEAGGTWLEVEYIFTQAEEVQVEEVKLIVISFL